MKIVLSIVLLIFGFLTSVVAQPNAEKILRSSIAKCNELRNCRYTMTKYFLYTGDKDTSATDYTCYVERRPADSTYSFFYHLKETGEKGNQWGTMYNGKEYISYSTKDSTGEVIAEEKHPGHAKAYTKMLTFYTLFTDSAFSPFPSDLDFADPTTGFEYLGQEQLNGENCHRVRMNPNLDTYVGENDRRIRWQREYWISTRDLIPRQYSASSTNVAYADTTEQYLRMELKSLEWNPAADDKLLTRASIPSHMKLEDYKPYVRQPLLSIGSQAPDWTLVSLNDDSVHLSDFRGKVVLLDFFVKGCPPCLMALPGLQSLHENYAEKGLVVVGVDLYDTKEKDDIANFLGKRGVTYPVVLHAAQVAAEYRVVGYPTLYIVDKNGIIVHTKNGYHKGFENELAELIKEHL